MELEIKITRISINERRIEAWIRDYQTAQTFHNTTNYRESGIALKPRLSRRAVKAHLQGLLSSGRINSNVMSRVLELVDKAYVEKSTDDTIKLFFQRPLWNKVL